MYIATKIHLKSSFASDFLSSISTFLRLAKSMSFEMAILLSQFDINFFFSLAIVAFKLSSLFKFYSEDM